ncbi:hypothetical protein A2477_00080 [Candidatus Falkowbacteria bacterium RIFOXYC2_FULL_47_12]|uniref:Uncharacterized protein n=1 Tax=Candidatus Falkowbacteria bacterium RIFOXYC2_FULL_47_12 TaxID=1798004 RepID=A0A1F5TRN0_9BACT|nr:MAG: hypothetical protein A2477_00080 [Candidatus Falkowbacteria bacterium RIFOXYC2_FULL_47_12]
MLNKKNVIIVGALVIIIVALVIAFKSFTIRSVNPDGMVATNGLPAIDPVELAQNYQRALRAIFPRYREVLESGAAANAAAVREELLALTVPAEYRDVHARLVLLLDSLTDGTPDAKLRASFAELTQANEWLYNLTPDAQ